MSDGMIELGKPIRLGEHSDVGGVVSNYYKCKTRKATIVPVKFKLAYADLFDNTPGPCITYNYGEAMSDYSKKLSSVGMSGIGVECYFNDSTSGSDTISNNFKDNSIAEKMNNISDIGSLSMLKNIRNMVKSSGGSVPNPAPNNAISNIFLEGKHLSLPKIFESSNYDSSISFSISLVSPYGSKRSIKKHIIEPLCGIWALASSMTYDGATYGNPGYVSLIAPGLSFIQLGAIFDLNKSGSSPEEEINIYGQSMNVQISFTVRPVLEGFAAAVNGDISSIGSAETPASFVNSGLAVNTIGGMINSLRPGKGSCSGGNLPNSTNFSVDKNNIDYQQFDFENLIEEKVLSNMEKIEPMYSNIQTLAEDFSNKLNKAKEYI